MVWEDVMSDKIYKDSWGAKYKRSAFGSVKGKDGHRYDQVSMGPLGNIFGTLFWIAIIVYAIISDPFMAAYILLIILSIVAAIRGLLGIKDKSNAKAPSNLMAAGSIWAFFIAFSINYDMGANLYTLYVLSLVLALGFLIASRMRLYAIFGFISLVLDIACSVLYVYGFMENASAFILALLVLILPLLARDEESELRPLHIAALVLIGLLAAKHVLMNELEADYGSLCYESALVWGFWILFAIGREFFATGGICGWPLMELEYKAASLQEPMFGFLAAGMALAFVNGILKKNQITAESFWVILPAILVTRPFTPARFGEAGGAVFAIAACLIMFFSVRKTLVFSRPGKAYRKMPVELISMGFIYMVLSVY